MWNLFVEIEFSLVGELNGVLIRVIFYFCLVNFVVASEVGSIDVWGKCLVVYKFGKIIFKLVVGAGGDENRIFWFEGLLNKHGGKNRGGDNFFLSFD